MASPATTPIAIDRGLDGPLEIPPRPPSHPFRFGRVRKLLASLRKDPEQTELALEVFDAVGGNGGDTSKPRTRRFPESSKTRARAMICPIHGEMQPAVTLIAAVRRNPKGESPD